MELYKNKICLTHDELTCSDSGEPIMSKANYKQLSARNRINVIKSGKGLDNYALIEYDTMPERFKIAVVDKYGEPADVIKKDDMNRALKFDGKAFDFYATHKLVDGKGVPDSEISKYVTNATVLNELISTMNNRQANSKMLGGQVQRVWDVVFEMSEQLRESYNHTLPGSLSRLRDKINEYKHDGYESLILKKLCNQNTVKITKDAGDFIVALKRSRVSVYNNEQIFEEYNKIAESRGWKILKTVKSIVRFLNLPETEPRWYDAVYGELAANQHYSRRHKTILPQVRDALWYSDGSKLNLYYKDYDKGKLVVKTTSVYEVMDAYSEVFLGYDISDTENYSSQYNAFRMAIGRAKHRPYEIVNDNQGGHKKAENTGLFSKICRLSRRTAPYSGQSKTIESAFGRFQGQYLRSSWCFTGQNITATSLKSRANIEFVAANKESLFTLSELKEAYVKAREEWNNAPHPTTGVSRIEMYMNSVNLLTDEIRDSDMVEIFWTATKIPSTFTQTGITITLDKKKYTYDVIDKEGHSDGDFRDEYLFDKFIVKYDPMDMTLVKLYTESSLGLRYVTDASPYVEIHRAKQDQELGEMAFIAEEVKRNNERRVRQQMRAVELEYAHGVAPEQHGLKRPKIKGLNNVKGEKIMDDIYLKPKIVPQTVDVGEYHKVVSNITYDQLQGINKM